jgi:chemotaxis protein CheC
MTPEQIDALKELINIGVGRAAGMLNQMVNIRVHLKVPFVRVLMLSNLVSELEELGSENLSTVKLNFKEGFSGTAALIFPTVSASNLVAVLTGEKVGSLDLDSVRAGTLKEVGNIMINGIMGSIGNVLKFRINYSIPSYAENTIKQLISLNENNKNKAVVLARTRFILYEHQVEGDIILFFDMASFDKLSNSINTFCMDIGK